MMVSLMDNRVNKLGYYTYPHNIPLKKRKDHSNNYTMNLPRAAGYQKLSILYRPFAASGGGLIPKEIKILVFTNNEIFEV